MTTSANFRSPWLAVGLSLLAVALAASLAIMATATMAPTSSVGIWARRMGIGKPLEPRERATLQLADLGLRPTVDAFLEAAAQRDPSTVGLFITAGIEPNARSAAGATALSSAAKAGRLDIVTFLVEQHKADVHAQVEGVSITDLAAKAGRKEVVEYLVGRGGNLTYDPEALGKYCALVWERGQKVNRITIAGTNDCGFSASFACFGQYDAIRQEVIRNYAGPVRTFEKRAEKHLGRKITDDDCCKAAPDLYFVRRGECVFR